MKIFIKLMSFLIITLFSMLNNVAFAQDSIETNNGQVIYCKIVQIDSTGIAYLFDETTPENFIEISEIVKYRHNGEIYILKQPNQKAVEQIAKPLKAFEKNSKHIADSIEKLHPYFVYTYTGQIITGQVIELKQPFLSEQYITVDGKRILPNIVKFYKNEAGFFANTTLLSTTGRNDFVQRIRKGEINLYEKVTVSQNVGHFAASPHGGGMYIGGGTNKTTRNFYNIGFDDVKNTTYKNLYPDLSSNPESLVVLNKFKSTTNTQNTLFIVGGVLATVGFATLIHKTKDWDGESEPKPNVTFPIISIGGGIALAGIGRFISNQKPQLLREAIDIYNRQ